MKLNTLLFYTDLLELQAALQHFFGTETPTTIYLYVKVAAPTTQERQKYPQYNQESLQKASETIVTPLKKSLEATKHITWVVRGSDKFTGYAAYVTQVQQPTLSLWQKIGQIFNKKTPNIPTPTYILPTTAPRLRISVEDFKGQHTYNISEIITTIGRTATIATSVFGETKDNKLVSRQHAQVVLGHKEVRDARGNILLQDQWYIEDISTNGIWINSQAMNMRYAELHHSDCIQLGGTDVVGKCPKLVIDIQYPAIAEDAQLTFYKGMA